MQLDRQYRAVVALNNIGVSLLEMGRHKQAQTTLLDAMLMLKPAFQGLANGPSPSDRTNGPPDVDKLMLQANQRYARTIAIAGAVPVDTARVLVVTSLADAADLKVAVGGGSGSSHLHPIRLELNDHEVLRNHRSSDNKEEVYVTCFAIVHNCSIAHFLATDYDKAHEATRQKPFRMLEACHRIVSGLGTFVGNHHSLRQQAYLDFIAHKTYMDMLRTTHRSHEAGLVAFHLERLRDGMDEAIRFDRMMNLSSSTSTLAPAA